MQQASRKHTPSYAAAFLCAFVVAAATPGYLRLGEAITHSALTIVLFALLVFLGGRFFLLKERRLQGFALAFGFVFSLTQLAGARLDAAGSLGGGWAPLALPLLAAALAPAAGACFAAFARLCVRWGKPRTEPGNAAQCAAESAVSSRASFLAAFAVILLCWLPYYLAYFPGMFNYDSGGEASQFLSGSYDGSFPPFHTLLLAGFYFLGQRLGSPNTGIALYTALQAAALAASMAAAVALLKRLGCRRSFLCVITACFALLPFFPLLAMSTTKDIFFGSALLFLLLALHRGRRQPGLWTKPGYIARVVLLAALVCLLRQNGVAAVAAALITALCCREANRKRLIAALLGGLLLFGGAQLGMNRFMRPAARGIGEALSVPLSQVARVYARAKEQETTLPEEQEILAFIPDANRYQRHIADGVKRHAAVGVSTLPRFLDLYGRLLRQYPADFADAWAYLTKAYWHLDDVTHLDIYAERGGHGYMETACQTGYGVIRRSLWPTLEAALDRLFVANGYKRIPVLGALIEPALWCWLLGAVLWTALYRRNRAALLCGAPLLGLFLTLLFGPCAYMRYAFPLALCALPMLGLCLTDDGPNHHKGGECSW